MSDDVSERAKTVTTGELRRQAKRRIQGMSEERLRVADDFLAYLEEREGDEATEELLRIPGFIERFKRAQSEIADGKVVSLKTLQRRSRGRAKSRGRRQS